MSADPKRRSARLRAGICALVAVASVEVIAACGGGGGRPPRAMLSSSVGAQREWEKVVKQWTHETPSGRIAMEASLVRYAEMFPDDELVRAADALLAWIELERGDIDAAEVHAFRIQIAGPGEVSDIARTVQGAALRRKGRPEDALGLLMPLEGKVIDPWARELLNEELVATALANRRWRMTVHYCAVWLRETDPDKHDDVKRRILEVVGHVPANELLRGLERGKRLVDANVQDNETEVRSIYAQRLAEIAKQTKDVKLAQQLLEVAGTLLGESGDSVAQLASGAANARVEPRTVGLLISIRNEDARRRAIDVAAGVAFGLGLPGSAARLVSRDDGGALESFDAALNGLASDGASIVIGGGDEAEAAVLARFAARAHLPVVLLRPAHVPEGASPFVFVVGEDPGEVDRALVAALSAAGARPVAVIADPTTPITAWDDVAVRRCGDLGAPYTGLKGLVLGAGEGCTRDALAAMTTLRVKIAAGFDAQGVLLPPGTLRAATGAFPVDASAPGTVFQAWMDAHDTPPPWFSALGRDAAALALAALQALPLRGTEDPREVVTYRNGAAAALSNAVADLWTTDAKGFAGTHQLARTIATREVGPPARPTRPARRR